MASSPTSHTPKNGPISGVGTPPSRSYGNGPLCVLELLKKGLAPSQIWKQGLIPERTVKRALTKLKRMNLVKNIGYGVWEIIPQDPANKRTGQSPHRVTITHSPKKGPKNGPISKPETVRGHGIVATVKIPRFLNWTRELLPIVLGKKGIPFEKLGGGQGFRIAVGDIDKVWLCMKSIVIYFPPGTSWFGETADKVAVGITQDVIKVMLKLEKMLGISTLKIGGSYWMKFSRQHDSLIKDSLARIYNKRGQNIEFRNEVGLWGLIDNSFSLEELETVRGEKEYRPINPTRPLEDQVKKDDAARDDNRKMQNFVNGIQRTGITPEFILEGLSGLTQQSNITQNQLREAHSHLAMYAQNLESHVGAVRALSSQASENAKTTVSLREAVQRLADAMLHPSVPVEGGEIRITRPPKHPDKSPSVPLAAKPVLKMCGLCGTRVEIPGNKDLCPECEGIVKERRPAARSLDSYLA